MTAPRVIELAEFAPRELPAEELSDDATHALLERYASQVDLQPPWAKTGDRWRLTSHGYMGYIPVSPALHLALRPKVPLGNLFAMLEYAYRVGDFLEGHVDVASLQELFERLALVLARRVLDRARRGLYRSYIARQEHTPFLQGRIDLARHLRSPWDTRIHCQYQDHTPDIDDNRILGWTLYAIARSGVCSERAMGSVRQAYRQMRQAVTLQHVDASACLGRHYHRLNDDYRSLHALCRFFLENAGPTYRAGDHAMVPFLISMSRLFEVSVAEWLKRDPPAGCRVVDHTRFTWDEANGLRSDVDLVRRDARTGQPLAVLDTKYKAGDHLLEESDVHQVVFCAQATRCHDAVLIYPVLPAAPVDTWVDDIRVRTLAFPLDGDLEAAGHALLASLGHAGPTS